MDEYIKRSEILRLFTVAPDGTRYKEVDCDNFPVTVQLRTVKKMIREAPASKVREDIPAKWVEHNIYTSVGNVDMLQSARCSKCEKYHTTPYSYYFDHYNFCPNCGARMTDQRGAKNKSAT